MNAAPAVLAGVFVVTFLAALPLGLVLRQMIAENLGASETAAGVARGVDYNWWQQFANQATGVGRTFSPTTAGGAAVLGNISAILDNRPQATAVAAAAFAYALVWLFLAGGILDRYARDRRTRAPGFFAACGTWFFRFVRLEIAAALVYFALFAWLHGWLFGSAHEALVRDTTVEWKADAVRVLFYALFGAVLCACNLLFDYARVRAVVEDRRSMAGAFVAAVRMVRARPGAVALYLLDGCCFVLLVAIYVAMAPAAWAPVWLTLLAGQAYLLARLWVKLLFYASEIAFFQAGFAHAGYVAAPVAAWPDSPAEEAVIRNP